MPSIHTCLGLHHNLDFPFTLLLSDFSVLPHEESIHVTYFLIISNFLKAWYKPPWPHHSCVLHAPNSSTFFQQTISKDLKFTVKFAVETAPLYSANFLNYLLSYCLNKISDGSNLEGASFYWIHVFMTREATSWNSIGYGRSFQCGLLHFGWSARTC